MHCNFIRIFLKFFYPSFINFDFSISGCATITSVLIIFHPLCKLFNPLRISMYELHIIEKYVLSSALGTLKYLWRCYMNQNDDCPIATTLEVIGGKWKVHILCVLLDRKMRTNEIKREIPNITQKFSRNNFGNLKLMGLSIVLYIKKYHQRLNTQ